MLTNLVNARAGAMLFSRRTSIPFHHLRVRMLLVGALTALGSLMCASAASAGITPAGDNIKIAGSNIEFKFSSTTIVCSQAEATGQIANPVAAAAPISNPTFSNAGGAPCGTVGMSGATFQVLTTGTPQQPWELVETSQNSGKLEKSHLGPSNGLEFVSGACRIETKADSPEGLWTNTFPSTLQLVGPVLFARPITKQQEEKCPAALVNDLRSGGRYTVNGTLSVTDTTFSNKAIRFG